jgi:hypothetical protein
MNSANNLQKKERVNVYVDGFNLYFGIIEAGFGNCKFFYDFRYCIPNILVYLWITIQIL